jgi:hypothetical protein
MVFTRGDRGHPQGSSKRHDDDEVHQELSAGTVVSHDRDIDAVYVGILIPILFHL